jgi:hypothetical protein
MSALSGRSSGITNFDVAARNEQQHINSSNLDFVLGGTGNFAVPEAPRNHSYPTCTTTDKPIMIGELARGSLMRVLKVTMYRLRCSSSSDCHQKYSM